MFIGFLLQKLMEDLLSKIPRRKTVEPVLDVDHFKKQYGIREDGTTSQTASILAAAGVKPEPTEQAVTVDSVDKAAGIDILSRPTKRPKNPSKAQNDVALPERGSSMRLGGDADFRKCYGKVLLDFKGSLLTKTGYMPSISHSQFVQTLLMVVAGLPKYNQLLVDEFEKQKKQEKGV